MEFKIVNNDNNTLRIKCPYIDGFEIRYIMDIRLTIWPENIAFL